ncbi:MAG TPA: hypothetical protein PK668_17220 [Myxococcota bacterium]|nr:hypothetical protein [Myxococcota bacterium]HRY94901.1 hypothetical protein [Myxococcota bacterium]HSA21821.1 hypothetical protein [Myxococcota bacterium]
MAFNPNNVPWLTVVGLLGAGIGFLVGRLMGYAGDPMVPPLYGFCAGMVGGVITRIVVRQRWQRRQAAAAGQDGAGDKPPA